MEYKTEKGYHISFNFYVEELVVDRNIAELIKRGDDPWA